MTGRQRSFEKDAMLRTIMCVFWRNGYAGTSMANLTNATGLTKPSLYLAYGNKEEIFKASLGHYLEMQSEVIGSTLNSGNGTVSDCIADFLKASARSATQTDRPLGCFILAASSEAHSSAMPSGIRELIDNINNMALNMLIDFFKTKVRDSENRTRSSAEYVLVLQSGIMQMALRGLDYAALENVIDMAIERAAFD
jgi:AcrR family transcriptional regulator